MGVHSEANGQPDKLASGGGGVAMHFVLTTVACFAFPVYIANCMLLDEWESAVSERERVVLGG